MVSLLGTVPIYTGGNPATCVSGPLSHKCALHEVGDWHPASVARAHTYSKTSKPPATRAPYEGPTGDHLSLQRIEHLIASVGTRHQESR
jgi:hypothetical protein